MFSSPAFRLFNTENSESVIQRKPGGNAVQTRKPFVDRTVNCNTPDVSKKQKTHSAIKETVKSKSPCPPAENLEFNPEHYFSYKDVEDQFEDLIPYSKRLEEHHIFTVLKNYLDDNTPPPSPTMKTAELCEMDPIINDSFDSNKSYDDDIFVRLPKCENWDLDVEPIGEVELPECDFDSL